jgi:hypothetical protein
VGRTKHFDHLRVTSEALGVVEASVIGDEKYACRNDLLREWVVG